MTQRKLELKPAFIERITKILSKKDFEEYLAILEKPLQNSIRCNTLKISPEELKQRLEEKEWEISQPWKNYPEVMIIEGKLVSKSEADEIERKLMNKGINIDIRKDNLKELLINNKSGEQSEPSPGWAGGNKILVDLEPGELGRSLEHLLGYYYVQELASMLPSIALEPKENELILDLCSAPGSKTTQIASKMKNTGTIIANELSFGRIKILASNLERCGVTNTIITKKEGSAFCSRFKRAGIEMDKILIDAPCSGEGTLRNSPKTSLMWNPNTIKTLSKIQKTLVKSAIEILKKGGTLVYSTCTHAPEENEEIVDYILNEFKEMKIEKINLPLKFRPGITSWQNKKYNEQVKQSYRIYPQDNDTEGFFVSKFVKK